MLSLLQWKPSRPVLDPIEAGEYSLVAATWKDEPCIVKVRELSDIQIQAVGSFSLIEAEGFHWSRNRKRALSDLVQYSHYNAAIARAALVSPTFEQIYALVGRDGFHAEVKAQLAEINTALAQMPKGPARQELEAMRDALVISWDAILPADFVAAINLYALGIYRSDIKQVTEDMLYGAAILAERAHVAPHEYVRGRFTDFNIRDIDTRAWVVYEKRMAKVREEVKQRGKSA